MVEYKFVQTLLYKSDEGAIEGDFIIGEDTLWANQKVVSEIFGTTSQNISQHFNNIIQDEELIENEVCLSSKELFGDDPEFIKKNFKKSNNRGRPSKWYNLDAIISIGYRINSKKATQFRKWSNKILKEYMIKGFVINEETLKQGGPLGKDYFDELLEQIREIRASERRLYQKVTDLFATSYDYNSKSKTAKEFYATVQNKLHFAITGQTAAEIISNRADHEKKYMGLTTWKNSPDGKILKSDVTIAKNYLDQDEIKNLERLVNMYLDYAENQASRHKVMKMVDWAEKLDGFLEFNEYNILTDKGKISKEEAEKIVTEEYDKFRPIQDKNYVSDFDKLVGKIKKIE